MRVHKCKGSRDLSPQEMARFRLVEGVFRDSCSKWGYEEVRTPTLEYLHLFTSTGTLTPSMLGKVYSFLDWDGWSGERVVLRPDGTIPIARLYIDNMQDRELAKLFYVSNVFIFEETGKETREKWQCGAELIGGHSPLADVELIILAAEVLQTLGLKDLELRLSHAGLIKGLLLKLGLSSEEQNKVFDQILDGDASALTRIKTEVAEAGAVLPVLLDLNLKGESSGFLKNLKAVFRPNLVELEPLIDNFINIVELLEALGCRYQIDLASGRGFEYYTGLIFQFVAGEERVGGGGRYDALIPLMGGNEISASGFALYLDRLMNLVKPAASEIPVRILVRVEPGNAALMKEGFSIAARLRKAGYVAELSLRGELDRSRWVLDVRSEAPPFVITDPVKQKRFEAQSVSEIIALLKGQGS